MLEIGRINTYQLFLIFITSRIILSLTYFPAVKAPPANQDLWLALLVSIPMTLLLAVPFLTLAAKYPHQTLITYSQTITGKAAGKICGLFYLWFFLHEGAITVRQFGEFLNTALLHETSTLVFLIIIVLLAAYAVRKDKS